MTTTTPLLPRLRAWFGLSQTELGRCLGLSRVMVSQVERGVRGLPLPAGLPQAALTLAYHHTPPESTLSPPIPWPCGGSSAPVSCAPIG
ncbi:helix-turn-helix transcriptional regulator [Hymenobacter sp. J193]|uniref:helix-turn-helix domain-containing protein n=1 Tax=Hymenobacter sp. J193 TaxID=2898429 RepID=UPI002151127E|nr:helix-turn-helix transcriptional regulator [Hymenobacter sp. J193]MCR5886564.1 helix-turn-helix transcriptional regulator [Hymenobacter sp. J193]